MLQAPGFLSGPLARNFKKKDPDGSFFFENGVPKGIGSRIHALGPVGHAARAASAHCAGMHRCREALGGARAASGRTGRTGATQWVTKAEK